MSQSSFCQMSRSILFGNQHLQEFFFQRVNTPIMKSPLNDFDILHGILLGGLEQEKSCSYLFKKYKDWIRLASQRHQLTEEESSEAYHDAILAFQQQVKKGQFRGQSGLSTYLNSIFQRKCIDQIRRRNRQKIHLSEIDKTDVIDPVQDIEQQMIISELYDYVMRQIDQLGNVCKQVLLDRYYWGVEDMAEIALRAGLKNANTAGSIRYRSMKQLTKRLNLKKNKNFGSVF